MRPLKKEDIIPMMGRDDIIDLCDVRGAVQWQIKWFEDLVVKLQN